MARGRIGNGSHEEAGMEESDRKSRRISKYDVSDNEPRKLAAKVGKLTNSTLVPQTSSKTSTYLFFIVAISGELGGETSSLYAVAFV